MNKKLIETATLRWLREVVIEYGLCPFAQRELNRDSIKFVVTEADDEAQLVEALATELAVLVNDPAVETCLLIHPEFLQDFQEYNQFLDRAEHELAKLDLVGEIQIASFHPEYQFANTRASDAENFTNKSPYPMLHLLRESSLEKAIASHPDVAGIPVNNIKRMKKIGSAELGRQLRSLTDNDSV